MVGSHGSRAWGSCSHCILSDETERDEYWCSNPFLPFIQLRTLVHGMVPPALGSLPTLIKPTEQLSHKHPRNLFSRWFQIKLTVKPLQRCQTVSGHSICKKKNMTDSPEISLQTAELERCLVKQADGDGHGAGILHFCPQWHWKELRGSTSRAKAG